MLSVYYRSSFLCLFVLVAFGVIGVARTNATPCDSDGIQSGSTCVCPPGFGGPTCDLLGCGGTIFQGSQRPLNQPQGNAASNFSDCTCEIGWTGAGCNVCTTANACLVGFSFLSSPSSFHNLTDPTQNLTMTCNTESRVFAASQMSCKLDNPTLQTVFPGRSDLNIIRTLSSSLTPAPGFTSFGPNASVFLQLFHEGIEQFFCNANNCTQEVSDGSDWRCQNLQCTCKPETTFCGGGSLDLTQIINGLDGQLEINCGNSTNGDCTFQQALIASVFGTGGFSLTGCQFGECVQQFVIDDALNISSVTTASAGKELSDGVIAGLAIVGTILIIIIVLLFIGKLFQTRAKKNGSKLVLQGGIGVRWENIGYAVPLKSYSTMGLKNKGDNRELKVVLDPNMSRGVVRPGQMLAILGPSGAGKTSLVDILVGKRKLGKISGKVEYFDLKGNLVKNPKIGFVDQLDTLPQNLTPREYLRFVADLRLPESISKSVKEERVSRVLLQLGLENIAEIKIGSGERRGISGGEMRRVSLGCELVAGCDVIILDEPTSGLDSVSAAKVANVLQSIASDVDNPTAVIATIHQPNSRLYTTFSHALVLSKGRTIYSGPGRLTPVQTLTSQGEVPPPDGYNIADWLLDIASERSGDIPSVIPPRTTAKPDFGNNEERTAITAADENILISPPIDEYSGTNSQEKRKDENAFSTKVERDAFSPFSRSRKNRYATTYMTQFEVLAWREWLNLRRDKTLFVTHIVLGCLLGVFIGGLYFQTGTTIAGFQSRVGCLFFIGALIAFTTISALYNLVEIRSLFLCERAAGYYSPISWLLSRIVFDLIPLRLIPTICMSIIIYWMTGLSSSAAHFFKFLLIIMLYSMAMTLFNFLLACLFRNGGIAILVSALTALYQQTYAGFFVNLNSIPPEIRWLQWLCPLKYTLEALSINEVSSGLMISDTLDGVPVEVSATLILDLIFGFSSDNYYRDILILTAFIVGFGILVILAVWYKVRERR